eukprot:49248-Chlamydomonas_euryale.AAC.1
MGLACRMDRMGLACRMDRMGLACRMPHAVVTTCMYMPYIHMRTAAHASHPQTPLIRKHVLSACLSSASMPLICEHAFHPRACPSSVSTPLICVPSLACLPLCAFPCVQGTQGLYVCIHASTCKHASSTPITCAGHVHSPHAAVQTRR